MKSRDVTIFLGKHCVYVWYQLEYNALPIAISTIQTGVVNILLNLWRRLTINRHYRHFGCHTPSVEYWAAPVICCSACSNFDFQEDVTKPRLNFVFIEPDSDGRDGAAAPTI